MILERKVVMITGGTGSLGRNLVRRIMTGAMGIPREIIVLSRDEDKQYQMRLELKGAAAITHDVLYRKAAEVLSFRIGDVRDYPTVASNMRGVNIVIHAAALKQVPACEYFPYESVMTNITGAQNIIRAASEHYDSVETVVGISTDKACEPINTYGMCKAVLERLIIEANLRYPEIRFVCTRYGNVAGSRGSVIPLFLEQIKAGGPVTVTRKDMTRFLLTLDQAASIVFDTIRDGKAGDTFVPHLRSANTMDVAEVMIGNRKIDIKFIGTRPGEKVHEALISEEEMARTIKRGTYYVVRPILPEMRDGEVATPVLTKPLSSQDWTMTKGELRSFLEEEGFLDL